MRDKHITKHFKVVASRLSESKPKLVIFLRLTTFKIKVEESKSVDF